MLMLLGGLVAGVINTLAGGGSLLTVPLMVFLGLPGTLANGTNRVGVVVQNAAATWRFRAEGVPGIRDAIPVLLVTGIGSVVGAFAISRVPAERFEQVFGLVMLAMLYPTLRGAIGSASNAPAATPWSAGLRTLVFFAIGLYGGAFQAGVGLFLLFALSRAGHPLVQANSIKVVVIGVLTLVAVPVFVLQGQVDWRAAAALAVGFALGGAAGVRIAVLGGDRVIRPVLALAVLAMAARLLDLY